jgi:hypothetical protein
LVVIPKGDVPPNPFTSVPSALALTKKIVEKHKEREERLRKMKTDAIEKSVHYARESTRHMPGTKDLKDNVRNFLSTKQATQEPPKTEVVNGIVFHAPGVPRPQSAGVHAVKSLPTTPKLPPPRPASSAQPRGVLAASLQQHSSHSNPDLAGSMHRRALSTAPGEMQSRSNVDADAWDDSRNSSPTSSRKVLSSALERQVKEMAVEIERLKANEAQAKVTILYRYLCFLNVHSKIFPRCG